MKEYVLIETVGKKVDLVNDFWNSFISIVLTYLGFIRDYRPIAL